MDEKCFEAYLTDRYQSQIKWYDEKAGRCRRVYETFQWPLLIFSTVTPILVEAGYRIAIFDKLLGLATLTSTMVAVLSAALNVFRYQDNWLNYRTACESLRKEKHFFDAGIGEYSDITNKKALFVERVEALIASENSGWLRTYETETRPTSKVRTTPVESKKSMA